MSSTHGGGGNFDFEDDEKEMKGEAGAHSRFKEFDCPDCNANNPVDETFGDGDEVRCNYCGTEFRVKITDEGRMKLREA